MWALWKVRAALFLSALMRKSKTKKTDHSIYALTAVIMLKDVYT